MPRQAVLAALAAAFLSVVAPRAQTPARAPSDSRTGLLAGRVTEGEGGPPVPGVLVAIASGNASAPAPGGASTLPLAMLTDGEGRFFFSALPAGTYRLTATKPGWIPGAYGRHRPGGSTLTATILDGGRRGDLAIPLWRYATISGRVVDEAGEPLVGREVRGVMRTFVAGRPKFDFVGRTNTDDRGLYRLSSLLPGDYLVIAPATVTSEPASLRVSIGVSGDLPHAYLQTMTDVATAQMSLDRANLVTGAGQQLLTTFGEVPAPPTAAGTWPTYPTTLHPAATTLAAATAVRAEAGRDQSGIDLSIRLTPTYQVFGVLMDVDGPAVYHAVHLVPADMADAPLFDVSTAVTDGSGAFTFYGVPPGQYLVRTVRVPWPTGGPDARMAIIGGTNAVKSVRALLAGPGAEAASSDPLMWASGPVEVGDRPVRDLRLTLQTGPRVRGRAVFDGTRQPPTDAELGKMVVVLEPANGRVDSNIMPGRYTPDGRFTTPGVLPGRYLVRPAAPPGWTLDSVTYQGRDVSETPLDLTADADDVLVTFVDRRATISGAVHESGADKGPGALVVLFPADPRWWVDYGRTSRRVQSETVSASATYSLALPPPGLYFLAAIPDDQAADWRNPAVLEKVAAGAERVEIRETQNMTQDLRVRRIQ